MREMQSWKLRLSFKNATILVCFFNLITALFLLHRFFSSSSRRHAPNPPNPVQLRYIKESEEIRRAMQPLELIRRVKEIEQEVYAEPDTHTDTKQKAALDLSKILTSRTNSDAANVKALEEWRKRKMERARQRELGKD